MPLDPMSMLTALFATYVLYTLLLFGMWLGRRSNDSLALWALSDALGAVSIWCMGMRGALPYGITTSLSNTVFIGAWMLVWGGMCRFSQKKPPLMAMIALPLAIGAVLQFVPALHTNYSARVVVVSLAWVTGILVTIVECARAERYERLYMRRALMLAFALLVGFVVFRAVNTLRMSVAEDKLMSGPLAGLTFFINMLIGMIWNLGLVLMSNEQLEKRLKQAANRDGLTNILNRRGFQELSQRVLLRSSRDRTPVSVLLMDLDYFKSVNDRFGHEAGDRMLCAFAEVARGAIRPTDLLARYGGEEFCVLLPKTSSQDALAVAERIRQDFATVTINVDGQAAATTVSIGAAEIAGDETVHQALSRADAALYHAKRKGRNRVEMQTMAMPRSTREVSFSSDDPRVSGVETARS